MEIKSELRLLIAMAACMFAFFTLATAVARHNATVERPMSDAVADRRSK